MYGLALSTSTAETFTAAAGIVSSSQEADAPNSVLERKESYSTQLGAILREENTTLKRELESYYQRVRKLQKVY